MRSLKHLVLALAFFPVLLILPSCSKGAGDSRSAAPSAGAQRGSKRDYVGLTRREAALKAWSAGQSYRIVAVDGVPLPSKGPRNPDRLNFTLENELVVKVTKG